MQQLKQNFPGSKAQVERKLLMNPFLETADIETASDDYASRFSGEVGKYFLDEQFKRVLEIAQEYESPTILDVGGGHAQLATPLIKKGYPVTITGSDAICEQRLQRELNTDSYSFQVCDNLNLPFPANSFDIVLAFRLIPHVDRWQRLIGELSRVAKKAVIVDYPDIRSSNILNALFFRLKKSVEGNTRPFGLFSRKQIAKEFNIHDCKVNGFHPEFFLPMVLHRKIGSANFSKISESISKNLGFTALLGSPIIVHLKKKVKK